jgi:hypothetical protein
MRNIFAAAFCNLLRQTPQHIMTVNNSNNMLSIDDWKSGHVVLHQQLGCAGYRFVRADRDDIF